MRTGQPIRPVVIAHRGASGYVAEHTLPAKALAYSMGADYLEQDLVATRDDELLVLHDIHLDRISDVADTFPGRHRGDGRYYARDFSLSEIKRLTVHERTAADGSPVYPGRQSSQKTTFRIQTFAEELQFIEALQEKVGRPVGIYPEIKRPAWHREQGVDITPLVLAVLAEHGYESHTDPVYLQCFDADELQRIRNEYRSSLKLIQLIGENDWDESNTNYDALRTARGLRRIAKSVDGIGPWVNRLYRVAANGDIRDSGLVARAHAAGLAVHPFTFRQDDLPPGFSDFDALLDYTIRELNIDGLFTDFPDIVARKCHAH